MLVQPNVLEQDGRIPAPLEIFLTNSRPSRTSEQAKAPIMPGGGMLHLRFDRRISLTAE